MSEGAMLLAAAVLCGTLSVVLAILVIRLIDRRLSGANRPGSARFLDAPIQPMVFLFRDGSLIDATPPARGLLDRVGTVDDDWGRLMRWIGPRIPEAAELLTQLGRTGRVDLTGREGQGAATLRMVAEDLGEGVVRVSLVDPGAEHAGIVVDSMSLQAMEEELQLLRDALDQTPMLVWREDVGDRITWANSAYLRRAETRNHGALGWPLPRLLDTPRPVPGAGTSTRRAALEDHGQVSWYDVHSHRTGEQRMMFALPADAAVRAERSMRDFLQTLTKTFADLPIGLAIFDQRRNLQLFNPALIDLTRLPAGFLTARPTLFDFLDQLRELRMAPEPKDYRSWRQQMANLESAAATGHHVETWSLPGGQTYRVTGRPHPDGAVAFLFENITSEMAMTRRFRADLLLGTTVLDGLEEALLVFDSGGQVILTNEAYRGLWGEVPDTLMDAMIAWEGRAASGAAFSALRDALRLAFEDRALSGAITGPQGQLLGWTLTSLSGDRAMLRFRTVAARTSARTPELLPNC
ncbi:PAS-domain containing protein [Paracoccus sp. 1_MG-2023]|uniref:PAS-domain containing protein n=1 Tax=unclassified Paracoccus (in: a-proteobacteria) TaxID=2688777 RepID=UPI001C09A762|nr:MULTISPECIES: PAS-domain containing protein [unclassified Paracoccus (in: a-proteobacteria)]MBU2957205.1 PAS-domain containing protein [Paracoccus sp. C2R09]MDO6669092.1 PAS-domain containing protein [Paracoccus sp. 1_MG-2023]